MSSIYPHNAFLRKQSQVDFTLLRLFVQGFIYVSKKTSESVAFNRIDIPSFIDAHKLFYISEITNITQ